MPELPEVETVRRSLLPKLAGHTITGVEIFWPRAVRYPEPEAFAAAIRGRRVEDLERRGKHLIIHLSGEQSLVVHLRMTGRLLYRDEGDEVSPYTTVLFHLDGGKALHFVDVRKFGAMHLVCAEEWDQVQSLRGLGVEPLSEEFTPAYLAAMLEGGRGPVKGRLLNQQRIAGLGNIYADEALHRAGIFPGRPAGSLSPVEVERLHAAIREVIAEGLAHRGTSVRDYVDGDGRAGAFQERLRVYRRTGRPCLRCATPIRRTVVAGRGTFYCPQCQEETGTGAGPQE
ncbi:MAG: bifunctional DNA-formamidopyrimidine glycosylase/DNA-(apurinic or apyrimidinic site) lyase [Bacillota bacterium]|nr:bifunctional DNA-formamidopyrimidine glycosylase/DNA-(apurinic or apyrimidinic site) lyase [Bacillota bacterium]